MRIILLLLTCMLSLNGLNAQVKFEKLNWEEALAKAEKEGKDVFVDVYRSEPADKLRAEVYKTVFTKSEISDFMNNNFVCIAIDMSTKEGAAFVPNLNSLMYPCMVFYTAKGDQLEATRAYSIKKDKSKLLELAKISMEKSDIKAKNNGHITFNHFTYEEALALAKKQNKLIFIDAYIPGCRPCAKMAKDVFTLNTVADFHNENFINLKIDFFTDRPDLLTKFEVKGYPAYMYINSDGNIVHKAGGYTEADKFMDYGKEALKKFSSIKFEHSSWKEAQQKAKQEGKIIFVDCYTVWCGPCKAMSKNVFTQKKVGDFFNNNFVNIKLDMEKEGKQYKSFLGVNAYPTLVFLDAEHNILHKVVGGLEADKLIAAAQLALDGKGIALYEIKLVEGERSAEFLIEYLSMLESAYAKDKIAEVAKIYFENVAKKELIEETNWGMLNKYILDYNSREFKYLFAKKDRFVDLYGEKPVERKIQNVWSRCANSFIVKDGENKTLDEEGYNKYLKLLKKKKVKQYESIKFYSGINNSLELGDWNAYVNGIEKGVNDKLIEPTDMLVYNWCLRVNQGCEDKSLRLKAAQWAKNALAKGSMFGDAMKKQVEELEK